MMKTFKTLASSPLFSASLVTLFSFVIYLRTMAPGVNFIDSGELATVAYRLGIAHPTGYPLFTLLGWLFSHLPLATEVITRLNIMAAFFCAAGLFVFYHVFSFALAHIEYRPDPAKGPSQELTTIARIGASAGATLLLAFSETYWSQATSVEVYSLHLLLVATVMLSFLKAIYDPSGRAWWYLFALVLGLSFTNHMTTILLAPGFLYLYFATQGWNSVSRMRVLRMAPPFLVGLSPYLYLPIRAAQSPVLNWGNTVSWERFLWHFSGKQYRVWIFSSTEAAGRQFRYFLDSFPAEFAYAGLVFGLIGIVALWRGDRKLFYWTLLLFVGCVLYAINYDIHDIDSYFLLAYICVAFWSAFGMRSTIAWLQNFSGLRVQTAAALVACLGLIPLFVHFSRSDESRNFLVDDYTHNMFASLQPNALILSYQWDYWVSASLYFQHVDGFRPDVVVVDKELLRRSWYLKQLGVSYPWFIDGSRAEVDGFLREVEKFEYDLPYNPNVIQARYEEMIGGFLARNIPNRPVYVTQEIEPEYTRGYLRVPEGLAFRLYRDSTFHPTVMPPFQYRPFPREGKMEDFIKKLYAGAFVNRGDYYFRSGNLPEARNAFKTALFFDPSSAIARRGLQLIRD